MSTAFPLLTVQDTVVAAKRICAKIDTATSPHRAVTGAAMVEIASMAILVGQLDAIAKAAARYATGHPDLDAYTALQERLLAAGYLPLPSTLPASQTEEAAHGQG